MVGLIPNCAASVAITTLYLDGLLSFGGMMASMGSISSEVERNTASSVPRDTTRPAYRLDAAAEKPHSGTTPSTAPKMGSKFHDIDRRALPF